ncbi:MAG: transglycosylase domain-containing protein [Bacteroidota bacterium]
MQLKHPTIEKLQSWLLTNWQKFRAWSIAFIAKHPKWVKAFKIGGIVMGASFLLVMILTISIYFGAFGKLPTYPELRNISNYTASEVYSDDDILLGKYFIENRVIANSEEISPIIRNALVATEDARFFKHGGIDVRSWFRVFFRTILMMDESGGGGSTISQQLAKNLFPRQSFGFFSIPVNKIKELFTARRLERLYSKEEILSLYLNTVSFSEDVFGIKVASQRFFNKPPETLQIEEAATLVGMLKAPTYYNPARNPKEALRRRNTVLNQMERYGYVEEEQNDSLKLLPLEVSMVREGNNQGLATYFREHLRLELVDILNDYRKPDGSKYNLYTDGLKIYTTIDATLQQYAENAVFKHMPVLQKSLYKNWSKGAPWNSAKVVEKAVEKCDRYKALKSANVSQEEIISIFATPVSMRIFDWDRGDIDTLMSPLDSIQHYLSILHAGFLAASPQDGLVKAWIGGINHKYFQYDHVKSHRQAGSTFKPLVYLQALRNGMVPCEYTYNEQVSYTEFEDWTPRNSDGEYGGVYSMEGALANSVNVVTVEVMLRAGIDSVIQLAQTLGFEEEIPSVPAISLGAVDASLQELVKVYGTFSNLGVQPTLHYLDRIETSDGKIIVQFDRPNPQTFERVMEEDESIIMTKMLQSVINKGTAARLRSRYGIKSQIAGKTGTTQKQTDGWFVGYTPELVFGAWVGADNPKIHFRTLSAGQGAQTALPIVGEFLQQMYSDPKYKSTRNLEFQALPDSLAYLMDCPPYLEDMPILVDFFQDYNENPGFFRRMYGELVPEFGIEDIRLKRQRNRETDEEYFERMRKYNKRLQEREERRRKELKSFWSKKLFGNKKDGNN